MMWRVLVLMLMFGLAGCNKKMQVYPIQGESVVPQLDIKEVYFQELIPGEEGGKSYLVLAVVLGDQEEKQLVSALVYDDQISLKKQGDRYTGLCPVIYSFEKADVPQVMLSYIFDGDNYVQLVQADSKEPIYMP